MRAYEHVMMVMMMLERSGKDSQRTNGREIAGQKWMDQAQKVVMRNTLLRKHDMQK